jgi:enterochelin esterase-like enzyme
MGKHRTRCNQLGPAISLLIATGLLLVSGCKKAKVADAVPETAPSAEQLASSRLAQFATNLKTLPIGQRDSAVQRFIKDNPVTPLIESDRLAAFFWYGNAKAVSINDDLQHGWATPEALESIPCGEDSFCFRIYQAPSDARLDYVLSIDGKETTDPRNPRVSPSAFGAHSEFVMPRFMPNLARQFRKGIERGMLDSLLLNSKNPLLKPRTVKIYKPAGYDSLAKLPALYVFDGLEALNYMSYTNVLDNLIADKKIKPVLVVFIEMLNEDIQLFPDKFPLLAEHVCGELVPLIDSTYKTAAMPSDRAITGISVWGNLAFITAFTRPEAFSMAAGQSTTVTEQLIKTLGSATESPQAPSPFKIYVDVGNYDLGGGALDNHSFLKANGLFVKEIECRHINHSYHVYNDGHQWANWRERTEAILCYFSSPAKE